MSILCFALFNRSVLSIPCNSSPNATLLRTLLCGNSPKCWNTIDIFFLRIPRSSLSGILIMFILSINTSPDVGFMSRLMQRRRVDFPLPDNPIITKISPSFIDRLAFFTATVHPVAFKISCLLLCSSSIFRAFVFSLPKMIDISLISIFDINLYLVSVINCIRLRLPDENN